MSERRPFCDENCNECPVIMHPNSRVVTVILNALLESAEKRSKNSAAEVYATVNAFCPNLSVCYDCRIDDFCHEEGCENAKAAREFSDK